jgi:DNA-binding XRE family transcriptional regulator
LRYQIIKKITTTIEWVLLKGGFGKMNKHHETFRQLSLNISHFRKKKGLTQQELAEIVGISHNHLAQIEAPNITRPFSIKLLFDIAEALGIEPIKLFDFGN